MRIHINFDSVSELSVFSKFKSKFISKIDLCQGQVKKGAWAPLPAPPALFYKLVTLITL